MLASPRIGVAILMLGVGMAIAFAAGFAWGDVALAIDVPVIRSGDGIAVSMLTGEYVSR